LNSKYMEWAKYSVTLTSPNETHMTMINTEPWVRCLKVCLDGLCISMAL